MTTTPFALRTYRPAVATLRALSAGQPRAFASSAWSLCSASRHPSTRLLTVPPQLRCTRCVFSERRRGFSTTTAATLSVTNRSRTRQDQSGGDRSPAADGHSTEPQQRSTGSSPTPADTGATAGRMKGTKTNTSDGKRVPARRADHHRRDLAKPVMPPGLSHWRPKPAPPRMISTPHLDAKLPEPITKSQKQVRLFLLCLGVFAILSGSLIVTDNYTKLHSSIVEGVLFMTRNDAEARKLIGRHIQFASSVFPWISGTVQQVKGKVDVFFTVKGDLGSGVVRFFARRTLSKDGAPGPWVTLEFSLTLPNGQKVNISQSPELAEMED